MWIGFRQYNPSSGEIRWIGAESFTQKYWRSKRGSGRNALDKPSVAEVEWTGLELPRVGIMGWYGTANYYLR
jgi:hypothetical protein